MNEPRVVLDYVTPELNRLRATRPVTAIEALWHVPIAILLPIACFILSADKYPANFNAWQSGQLRHYAGLIPKAACAWPFYPLLALSMTSAAWMVFSRGASSRPLVRLGLYGGIVLALQFVIIQAMTFQNDYVVFVSAIGIAIAAAVAGLLSLLHFLVRRFGAKPVSIGLVGLFGSAVAAALAAVGLGADIGGVIGGPVLGLLIAAPALTMGSFLSLSIRSVRINRGEPATSRQRFVLPLTWLAAYAVAWRGCITLVLLEYTKLPTSRPGCYIATAAARGHPLVVQSTTIRLCDGSAAFVNDQLRTMKCAELILQTTLPGLHRLCRRVYDRLGTALAARIRHPLLADLAYLSLKPIEWACASFIHMIVPDAGRVIAQLYRSKTPAACLRPRAGAVPQRIGQ
jgi:hypothetical protein